jgi:hypothetical protein
MAVPRAAQRMGGRYGNLDLWCSGGRCASGATGLFFRSAMAARTAYSWKLRAVVASAEGGLKLREINCSS